MTLWYLARAAGVIALIIFTAGRLARHHRRSGSRRPGAAVLAPVRAPLGRCHRPGAPAAHVVAVIADSNVEISPSVLVWPFGSGYRPFAMTVGVLALYGLVLAAVVGAARGRLARSQAFTKRWRSIHVAASVGWLLSIGHASWPVPTAVRRGCSPSPSACLAAVGAAVYRAQHLQRATPLASPCREDPMKILQETQRRSEKPRLLAGLDHGRADLARAPLDARCAARSSPVRPTPSSAKQSGSEAAAVPPSRSHCKLADLPAKGIEAVVVNGSESEPVSRKDRLLLTLRATPGSGRCDRPGSRSGRAAGR